MVANDKDYYLVYQFDVFDEMCAVFSEGSFFLRQESATVFTRAPKSLKFLLSVAFL